MRVSLESTIYPLSTNVLKFPILLTLKESGVPKSLVWSGFPGISFKLDFSKVENDLFLKDFFLEEKKLNVISLGEYFYCNDDFIHVFEIILFDDNGSVWIVMDNHKGYDGLNILVTSIEKLNKAINLYYQLLSGIEKVELNVRPKGKIISKSDQEKDEVVKLWEEFSLKFQELDIEAFSSSDSFFGDKIRDFFFDFGDFIENNS